MADQYFAAKPAVEAAAILVSRSDSWVNNLEANGYLDKLRQSWAAYHGAYYTDMGHAHSVTFSGVEGELANLPVNHFRNLCTHVLTMTVATRPSMEARATNTDYKSLTQTLLANGLLDYYMREKRLEKFLKTAVEYAIVLGSGYVKMGWNATSGETYDYNEETNTTIYEGDVYFQNLSPFDVFQDSTKENNQPHDWIVCRTWKNKYDLAAKYPELEQEILKLSTKSDIQRFKFGGLGNNETDDCEIWEFFHRRTESLPDGRYMMFCSPKVILYDGPMPYRDLPIYRIAPADILGTPYGYTAAFDLLPLQESINALYSSILTNQNAFAVQNIMVPRGADLTVTELAGGLNIIETPPGMEPKPLNLCQTPGEVFKFVDTLREEMETLSGVNSVARGNPEASLKSGAALALVQSQAIQFMSGLQASYVALIEDVGTGLIAMLRDYAAVPRVAAITGKSNRTYMKEFKGDDLSNVNRVVVDVANPLSKTTAGRVQMAEQLLQMGAVKNAQQYFTVINTGKLDVMMEGAEAELLLIKGENENMMAGETVTVVAVDVHKMHIQEHKTVLSDPDSRKDPKLVQIVLDHIQEHIRALQNTDPNLLQLLDQQPLAPPQSPPGSNPAGGPPQGAPPNGPPSPAGQQPPNPGAPPQVPTPEMQAVLQQQAPGMNLPHMPNVPHPPAPFQNLPTNPANALVK